MRSWLRSAASAAGQVANQPALWLPGALAWTVTVGWLALVVGVARAPTVAELTFFGAGAFTSGAWPWNVVGAAAAAVAVGALGFVLAAAAESVLVARREVTPRAVGRIAAIGVITAIPFLVACLALGLAIVIVATGEFAAPDDGGRGPLLRTVLGVLPFAAVALLAAAAGGAVHAAASRRALQDRGVIGALTGAPRSLVGTGAGGLAQALFLLMARLAYAALGATLLRVLWAPIGVRLGGDGIDLVAALLLVGFVSIWLCLVLGGGALHAWGSISWTRLLSEPIREPGPSSERMETRTGP